MVREHLPREPVSRDPALLDPEEEVGGHEHGLEGEGQPLVERLAPLPRRVDKVEERVHVGRRRLGGGRRATDDVREDLARAAFAVAAVEVAADVDLPEAVLRRTA